MGDNGGKLLPLTRAKLDWAKTIAPNHYQPVLDAIHRSRLAVNFVNPGVRVGNPASVIADRPSLVVIGDDAEGGSQGPTVFDRKTLGWIAQRACGVMVHSAAGDPTHYALMVTAALMVPGMSAVVIETTPRHHADWKEWADKYALRAAVVHVAPPVAGHA
ncbi:hypothetical protein [Azospirillum argentinense]|uniref:hypothetical protein n=1 Tax=Azospirillum argentinense TaxID=2970906 RepID=UPI0032DF27D4